MIAGWNWSINHISQEYACTHHSGPRSEKKCNLGKPDSLHQRGPDFCLWGYHATTHTQIIYCTTFPLLTHCAHITIWVWKMRFRSDLNSRIWLMIHSSKLIFGWKFPQNCIIFVYYLKQFSVCSVFLIEFWFSRGSPFCLFTVPLML